MRFSIITATKNSEKFLQENIDSVKKQTFNDFEHVFIDGYSSDKTVKIIEEYRKKFPDKVSLYQYSPQGISHAMNKGIEKAKGEFINHLHADDSFHDSTVLQDVADFLTKNEELDWIYGRADVIDAGGNYLHTYPNKPLLHYHDHTSWWGRYLIKLTTFIPHQAAFIKKSVFDKHGTFDENLSSKMDPDMWIRIRNKTNWSFYNRIICNYRVHKEAQSSSKENIKENQRNLRRVQKRYLNHIELTVARVLNLIKSWRNTDQQ